jgi:small-conductance mechanosensitive channel
MKRFLENWLFDPMFGRLTAAFIGALIITVFIRLVQRYLSRHVADPDVRYRARKLVGTIGYLLAIVFVATVFSDRLGGLTVAFGVAGAGIAFALQEVIASVAGWVAISFGNFYNTGDRIQLGGIVGDVIDIGILRTTLMECGQWVKADLYNGRIVRVANSFVFKEAVFNYSADFPFLWDEITVPVKYGCDRRLTREILERIAREVVGDYVPYANTAWEKIVSKYMIENAKTEPMVTLSANDNWMEFTVRYVVDYKKRRSTKDRLFTRILEEFDKTDGRTAVASVRALQLAGAGTTDARISDKIG